MVHADLETMEETVASQALECICHLDGLAPGSCPSWGSCPSCYLEHAQEHGDEGGEGRGRGLCRPSATKLYQARKKEAAAVAAPAAVGSRQNREV